MCRFLNTRSLLNTRHVIVDQLLDPGWQRQVDPGNGNTIAHIAHRQALSFFLSFL